LKGYNARQLRTEFPDKGWTKSNINRLLKKLRDKDTVDRRQGSGRPQSTHTDEDIDHLYFPEVNRYAFKKLVVLFIIFFFFQQ